MADKTMILKIYLPYGVFLEKTGVQRIVAETNEGSVGIYPNRLDCVAAVVPGIFMYESENDGEIFLATDLGMLVKSGAEVRLAVRNAIGDQPLGQLHEAVARSFEELGEREKEVRAVMARLESGFVRQFQKLMSE